MSHFTSAGRVVFHVDLSVYYQATRSPARDKRTINIQKKCDIIFRRFAANCSSVYNVYCLLCI